MGSDVGQIFPTASLHRDHSISYALVCEKNRIHHWCSVGTENPNPRVHFLVVNECDAHLSFHCLSLVCKDLVFHELFKKDSATL